MIKDIYDPLLFAKLPPNDFVLPTYYEIRIWQNHQMINRLECGSLKQARKIYKERFEDDENQGNLYVEIIGIKPLKKRITRTRVKPSGTK